MMEGPTGTPYADYLLRIPREHLLALQAELKQRYLSAPAGEPAPDPAGSALQQLLQVITHRLAWEKAGDPERRDWATGIMLHKDFDAVPSEGPAPELSKLETVQNPVWQRASADEDAAVGLTWHAWHLAYADGTPVRLGRWTQKSGATVIHDCGLTHKHGAITQVLAYLKDRFFFPVTDECGTLGFVLPRASPADSVAAHFAQILVFHAPPPVPLISFPESIDAP